MKRPLIGITCDIEDKNGKTCLYIDMRYGRMVEEAGGTPVLIHPAGSASEVVSRLEGLVLSGGEDIHPKYYGEKPVCPMELSPDIRTEFEVSLLKEAMSKKIPILGICHGMQLINVALGGSLYQDIGSQLPGAMNHRLGTRRHMVKIEKDSRLFGAIGSNEISVTSTHHQAVRGLGKGLKVCARAEDGIIEAFEMPDYPFLAGVQWHPEKEPDKESMRLFKGFVIK